MLMLWVYRLLKIAWLIPTIDSSPVYSRRTRFVSYGYTSPAAAGESRDPNNHPLTDRNSKQRATLQPDSWNARIRRTEKKGRIWLLFQSFFFSLSLSMRQHAKLADPLEIQTTTFGRRRASCFVPGECQNRHYVYTKVRAPSSYE